MLNHCLKKHSRLVFVLIIKDILLDSVDKYLIVPQFVCVCDQFSWSKKLI